METMDWLGHMWADDVHGIPPSHMTLVLGRQRTAHALMTWTQTTCIDASPISNSKPDMP